MAIIVAFLAKLVVMKLWGLIALPLAGWAFGEARWLIWQAILAYWNHLLGRKIMVPPVHRRSAIWVSGRTAELMKIKPTQEPYRRVVDLDRGSHQHPIN